MINTVAVAVAVPHMSVNTLCAVKMPVDVLCAEEQVAFEEQMASVVAPFFSVQLVTFVALQEMFEAVPERTRDGVALMVSVGD